MPDERRRPAAGARKPGPQLDLFPRQVLVEPIDPKERLGARTGVTRLWRVRWTDEPGAHLVFEDRHGRYCQEHGKSCEAVRAVAG